MRPGERFRSEHPGTNSHGVELGRGTFCMALTAPRMIHNAMPVIEASRNENAAHPLSI
jgi:hypothetical protein